MLSKLKKILYKGQMRRDSFGAKLRKNCGLCQRLRNSLIEDESESDVIFLVGEENDVQRITGHSWVLKENSPVFRAMFRSPLTTHHHSLEGSSSKISFFKSPKMTVAVSDVDGRAFDILLRYLYNETVHLQSVMTALTTLYAAHKYMCPGLAEIVIKYLKDNLNENNVLLVLQHICLYCNVLGGGSGLKTPLPITYPPNSASLHTNKKLSDKIISPSAPSLLNDYELEEDELLLCDDVDENTSLIQKGDCCEELLKYCLELIDDEATSVLASEDIEDLDIQAFKLIISRDSLSVQSELDTFGALQRWSKRECKRQKLELNSDNKRSVSDGAQYLIRWLTLSEEDFLGGPYHSGLLSEEEKDAIANYISSKSKGVLSDFPDHFCHLSSISMSSPRRRGLKKSIKKDSKKRLLHRQRAFASSSSGFSKKEDKKIKKKSLTVIANKDSSTSTQIKERNSRQRDKFNIVEEFFICLACIFD
ncbi:BTB/POZ domain-containing protein 3 isoform X2 [Lepeophtheirus salmonis]|uniref:BTB/POZ domain-containing protein 3 isoform X2 n=1 Tax=Lepeophtheirus salmonis TaxID=72036 RepID=UPI003AF360CC